MINYNYTTDYNTVKLQEGTGELIEENGVKTNVFTTAKKEVKI